MSGKRRQRGPGEGRRRTAPPDRRTAPPGRRLAPTAGVASPEDRPALRPSARHRLLLVALGLLLPVAALAVVEVALRALDVGEAELYDDPYVGFAPGSDLFAPKTLPDGTRVYETRPEKLGFFDTQRFAADKPADGYRIFALGGSTTAGRPYGAEAAFAAWLERYLRAADPSRSWEVVNAGGVSYASYRVALLMRELVRYEPDLFVVYTGHNEFLEDRTYGELREPGSPLERGRMWLSRFRFAALARRALRGPGDAGGAGAGAPRDAAPQTTLAPEVATKLDGWTGIEQFHRDDRQARAIFEHFEHNLGRIVEIARDHGAEVVFVDPVANLKDFSPFRSQHAGGLPPADAARCDELVARGEALVAAGRPGEALEPLRAALAIDPRYAETHYQLGRALLAAGEIAAAKDAFVRAKDEDVAPLRAPEPIRRAIRRVAAERGVPLVDFPALLEADSRRRLGHPILGDEYLLDHVHPDVPWHSRLAERLLDHLVAGSVAHPGPSWTPAARQAIYRRVVAGFDRETYARRDLNLAKVLGWAGKLEEAEAPLERAAEVLADEPDLFLNLGVLYQRTGRPERSLAALDRALELAPAWERVHFNRGVTLARLGRTDEAVAELREALRIRPAYPEARHNLETLLAAGPPGDGPAEPAGSGPPRRAAAAGLDELERAVQASPGDADLWFALGAVRARRGSAEGAEAAYRRALALDPAHRDAHTNLGILMSRLGRTGPALEHLRRATELAPAAAETWFNLGVALSGAGRDDEALAALERSVDLAPATGRFRYALGTVYAARGMADRALTHLEAARRAGEPVSDDLLDDLRARAGAGPRPTG